MFGCTIFSKLKNMVRHYGKKLIYFLSMKHFFVQHQHVFVGMRYNFLCNIKFLVVDKKHFFVQHQLVWADTRLLFVQHQTAFFFDTKLLFVQQNVFAFGVGYCHTAAKIKSGVQKNKVSFPSDTKKIETFLGMINLLC